jgi:S1-C subfamily serine protease/antitoxin component YwqK of YwqJK toxin-antitoxin module
MEWSGNCSDEKADGFGILKKYQSGVLESTYEGEFKKGIREGKGKFTHVGGTVLECNFTNGQAVGKGTYDLGDGNTYEGEIVNYREHGYGVYKKANGTVFDGFFVADRPYTGKWTSYNGDVTYIQKGLPVKRIDEESSGYSPEIGKRVTEYFDKDWHRCKQKDASFYRLITYEAPNKPLGVIKDFYINGQLQSEFYCIYLDYDDEGKNFHEGEATWYHKNGKCEQKRYYYNNKINGPNTFYFENGQLAQERNYNHGVLEGYLKSYYPNGNPTITAYYEGGSLFEQKYIEYDENGLGAIVYNENFFLNNDKWTSKTDEHESMINSDGHLELKLSNDLSIQRTNYISLDANSDYSIEATIHRKSGDDGYGYGLFFGFKDWNNYFQFAISDFGSYRITGKFEGIDTEITDWSKSTAINKSTKRNLLKVMKFGDEFIFSINGTIVERVESKTLRGNYYGILVYGKGTYVMENLIIKEFVSADELEAQNPSNRNNEDDGWKGNGSGLILSKNGYIVTNHHVIENASSIEVEFKYKNEIKSFKAEVITSDAINDLAIIKINDEDFSSLYQIPYTLKTRSSDVGTSVFALGYPMALTIMGKEVKFTDGKISSKTGFQGDITTYQTTVPIQPGNSGGPLFDTNGNLIGINSSGIDKSMADNVAYSIKSSYVLNLIDVLPDSIPIPSSTILASKPLTEQIKILSDYVVLIKVK